MVLFYTISIIYICIVIYYTFLSVLTNIFAHFAKLLTLIHLAIWYKIKKFKLSRVNSKSTSNHLNVRELHNTNFNPYCYKYLKFLGWGAGKPLKSVAYIHTSSVAQRATPSPAGEGFFLLK